MTSCNTVNKTSAMKSQETQGHFTKTICTHSKRMTREREKYFTAVAEHNIWFDVYTYLKPYSPKLIILFQAADINWFTLNNWAIGRLCFCSCRMESCALSQPDSVQQCQRPSCGSSHVTPSRAQWALCPASHDITRLPSSLSEGHCAPHRTHLVSPHLSSFSTPLPLPVFSLQRSCNCDTKATSEPVKQEWLSGQLL